MPLQLLVLDEQVVLVHDGLRQRCLFCKLRMARVLLQTKYRVSQGGFLCCDCIVQAAQMLPMMPCFIDSRSSTQPSSTPTGRVTHRMARRQRCDANLLHDEISCSLLTESGCLGYCRGRKLRMAHQAGAASPGTPRQQHSF